MITQVAAVCLSLLFPITDTFAQAAHGQGPHEVQIAGTVQASDGAVLPGATVHVFGTALTTTTDGDGRSLGALGAGGSRRPRGGVARASV